jgi:hypothetical protein
VRKYLHDLTIAAFILILIIFLPMNGIILNAEGRRQPTSIPLRTRSNQEIDNNQLWHLSRFEWEQLEDPKAYPGARRVNGACPVYNCHGLTFGSRRTSVFSSALFILKEDGFQEIPERDTQVGDIVVYFDSHGSESHTGIVIGEEYLALDDLLSPKRGKLPLIWSKWGKGFEVVHCLGNCPYDASTARFFRLSWRENEKH